MFRASLCLNNTSMEQTSLDYLNQITPKGQRRAPLNLTGMRLWVAVGAAAVIVIIILSIVATSISAGRRAPLETLAARLSVTATIVTAATPNISDSSLSATNSTLSLNLTQINKDIVTPMQNNGINVNKLPKSITNEEQAAGTKISDELTDAKLNAVFDTHYATDMNYQLSITMSSMQQIYNHTNSKSLKTFLQKSYSDLETAQKAFAEFSSKTNS